MKKNAITLLNDIFDDNFSLFQIKNDFNCLKTNIKELNDKYMFEINVAGIKKENINIDIEEGYLVVSVKEDEKQVNEDNNYIRREMSFRQCKRKYYVGEVTENQINASLKEGILIIEVPKDAKQEKKKSIEIN